MDVSISPKKADGRYSYVVVGTILHGPDCRLSVKDLHVPINTINQNQINRLQNDNTRLQNNNRIYNNNNVSIQNEINRYINNSNNAINTARQQINNLTSQLNQLKNIQANSDPSRRNLKQQLTNILTTYNNSIAAENKTHTNNVKAFPQIERNGIKTTIIAYRNQLNKNQLNEITTLRKQIEEKRSKIQSDYEDSLKRINENSESEIVEANKICTKKLYAVSKERRLTRQNILELGKNFYMLGRRSNKYSEDIKANHADIEFLTLFTEKIYNFKEINNLEQFIKHIKYRKTKEYKIKKQKLMFARYKLNVIISNLLIDNNNPKFLKIDRRGLFRNHFSVCYYKV